MSWLEQDNVLYKIIKLQVGCTAAAVNFCCRIFASLAKNLWNLCYSDLLGKFITPNSFLSTAGQSHNWISRYPCWFPFQTYRPTYPFLLLASRSRLSVFSQLHTLCLKNTSHLWLAMILTYTIRLR